MRRLTEDEERLWQAATSNVAPLDDRPDPVLTPVPRISLKEAESPFRLDLHGLTVQEAHDATARFLAQAEMMGIQHVRVITGRSGQIRQEFTRWLDGRPVRSEADRGGGSFVVRFKKKR